MNKQHSLSRVIPILIFAIAGLLTTSNVAAQQSKGFSSHAFFKHLIGEWTSEGELKGADGSVITIKQEFKAAVSDEGTLTIAGRREVNKDAHDYRWTIVQTASGGIYEVTHYVSSNGGETQRFEASVSEVELTMERTAPMGDNTLKLHDSFKGTDRDTTTTKVTVSDPAGKPILTGNIVNKRVKKP